LIQICSDANALLNLWLTFRNHALRLAGEHNGVSAQAKQLSVIVNNGKQVLGLNSVNRLLSNAISLTKGRETMPGFLPKS
jgi:hypothetical protein